MANDFGRIDKLEVMSAEAVNDLQEELLPISWAIDASNEISFKGNSVTLHLYKTTASPAVQNISGSAIDYDAVTSDLDLSPVSVSLDYYQPEGFKIPELVLSKSVIKDMKQFYGQKIHQLAKKINTNIMTEIDDSYSQSVSMSGAKYTWGFHQESVVKAVYDANMAPSATTVVLDNQRFTELVASVPELAGASRNDVLASGIISDVGGVKVVRSSIMPSGVRGFAATRDAMAIAIRPLAPLNDSSYGNSTLATSKNGITMRVREFQDPATGLHQVNFDLLYGRKRFNTNALVRIVA